MAPASTCSHKNTCCMPLSSSTMLCTSCYHHLNRSIQDFIDLC
uniref:Uncharacterized protein n=1 Tax=Arundo donax TaxID=35708 RepID=A0A0A8Y358_ARUDO